MPMSRGCPSSVSLSPPRGDRTLLVRHLPAELTAEEKEDLLKYFGAQSVRVLSDKGRLVRTRPSPAARPGPERGTRTEEGDRKERGRCAVAVGGLSSFLSKYRACQVKDVLIGSSLDSSQRRVKGRVERMGNGLVTFPFRAHPENHKPLILGVISCRRSIHRRLCHRGLFKNLGSFISQC